MVWKLAINPVRANNPRIAALSVPRIALKPSSRGSPETLISSAPLTPVLRNRTPIPVMTSVHRPHMVPLGTSRFGSIDSSAARGSSSMAR